MRIITTQNPVVLENTVKDGEYFSLNVYPNNTTEKIGFQLVFPSDCEIVHFSHNSIIVWRKRPKAESEE
jgi:hypothetical protein